MEVALLSLVEARVLASLVEKSITTPEYYPLTLNALTAACNQKSNRDPLMQLTDDEVLRTVDALRERQLAWVVTLAGSRVPKYQHRVLEVLKLSPPQLAVLCELMLRGPQTVGELRTRAARLTSVGEPSIVPTALQDLQNWPGGPLVTALPRQPGQREERYAQLWCGEVAVAPASTPLTGLVPGASHEHHAALEARVATLEDELARLKAQVADLVQQLQ